MFLKYFTSFVFLFSVFQSFGQLTGYRLYKEISVKGNSKVIGNNIVGIHPEKPYNDVGAAAKKNDLLPMVYIDIDDDVSTFSSSSATLTIPESASSIAYAGLYWAATYEYEEGKMEAGKTEYEYVPIKPRVESYSSILFKTPKQPYQAVQGIILEDYIDSIGRPYLCYADVTKTLQSISNVSGDYTVANMHATQGHVLGGSSGGWMLYVIYEDETASNKNFVLSNGFQPIEKGEYSLTIPKTDDVNTHITLGVLEGDERLKTDRLFLKYTDDEKPQYIFSRVRSGVNFFNSSITLDNEFFLERNPNSINTLGFDIASFDLPLDKNRMANGVKLNLTTIRDKFLLFFSAIEAKIPEVSAPVAVVTEEKTPKVEEVATTEKEENISELKVRQTLKGSSQQPGYYLVTNVFSDKKLAENWKMRLRDEGLSPESFINAKNNWEYVYVKFSEQIGGLYADYKRFKKTESYKDIWILEIKD